jgi:hypothetical protein
MTVTREDGGGGATEPVDGRKLRHYQAELGPEDDLAAGVAAFELGVGLADLR